MRFGKYSVLIALIVLSLVFLTAVDEVKSTRSDESSPLEPELLLIKGGEFFMGKARTPEEMNDPSRYIHDYGHKVRVNSFYMDRYEVTNYQYFVFCNETGAKLPELWGMDKYHCGLEYPNHPVVGVTWHDAEAYATWRKMRLPTEAEWEYAARGGLSGKPYPTGDDLTPEQANFGQKNGGTVPVATYRPNGYGLYDMAGNVREWVSDWYSRDYYRLKIYDNPRGPEVGFFKVLRDGGWHAGKGCNRALARTGLPAYWVDFAAGFRCAKDYKTEQVTFRAP